LRNEFQNGGISVAPGRSAIWSAGCGKSKRNIIDCVYRTTRKVQVLRQHPYTDTLINLRQSVRNFSFLNFIPGASVHQSYDDLAHIPCDAIVGQAKRLVVVGSENKAQIIALVASFYVAHIY
jgi:hypothetical protein